MLNWVSQALDCTKSKTGCCTESTFLRRIIGSRVYLTLPKGVRNDAACCQLKNSSEKCFLDSFLPCQLNLLQKEIQNLSLVCGYPIQKPEPLRKEDSLFWHVNFQTLWTTWNSRWESASWDYSLDKLVNNPWTSKHPSHCWLAKEAPNSNVKANLSNVERCMDDV